MVAPLVWSAAERDGFVADVQAMRRRVVDHIPADEAERQLKLGPGGLRDVEFAVQLLQLVHGRADPSLRPPATLSALAALTARRLRRPRGRRGAARGLRASCAPSSTASSCTSCAAPTSCPRTRRAAPARPVAGATLKDPVGELDQEWRHHRREVRRLHEKLFYRPLLAAVARLPGDEARLTPEAAEAAAGRARLRSTRGPRCATSRR